MSEICGKNWALATPISAFAATKVCSASRISGRRSSSDGRQARRHFGRKQLLHQRPSARHGLRIVAEENADGIFFLRDLPLQVGDLSVRRIENLLSLQNVELGGHAVLDAKIGELHRIFLRLDGVARDLELKVELQEREIVARHVAHERQHDRLPRILGGKQFGA